MKILSRLQIYFRLKSGTLGIDYTNYPKHKDRTFKRDGNKEDKLIDDNIIF